jgi:hypothetical protein
MSTERTRNWPAIYLSVIAVEILCLLALWWVGRHFGSL